MMPIYMPVSPFSSVCVAVVLLQRVRRNHRRFFRRIDDDFAGAIHAALARASSPRMATVVVGRHAGAGVASGAIFCTVPLGSIVQRIDGEPHLLPRLNGENVQFVHSQCERQTRAVLDKCSSGFVQIRHIVALICINVATTCRRTLGEQSRVPLFMTVSSRASTLS